MIKISRMELCSLTNAADLAVFEAHRCTRASQTCVTRTWVMRRFGWAGVLHALSDLIFEPASWFLGALSFVTDIKEATLWSFSKTEAGIKETSFDKPRDTISTGEPGWKFQASIIYSNTSEGCCLSADRTASGIAMATHRLTWLILAVLFLLISCWWSS